MPRTVVDYVPKYLNNAASASPTGSVEAATSLPIATGLEVGSFIEIGDDQAAKLSYTTTGTLYSGTYMFVQLDPAYASTALTVGTAVFWKETSDVSGGGYVVTPTDSGNNPDFAGVVIDASFAPATPYAWIQLNGKASVKFAASLTNGSPAYGDVIGITSLSVDTFDDFCAAAATTGLPSPALFVGIALEAPVGGAVKKVRIQRAVSRF